MAENLHPLAMAALLSNLRKASLVHGRLCRSGKPFWSNVRNGIRRRNGGSVS
jgi:hypothetical protein